MPDDTTPIQYHVPEFDEHDGLVILHTEKAKLGKLQSLWTALSYAAFTAFLVLVVAYFMGAGSRSDLQRVDQNTGDTRRVVRQVADTLDQSIHDNRVAILINRCLLLNDAPHATDPIAVLGLCVKDSKARVRAREKQEARSEGPRSHKGTSDPQAQPTPGNQSGGSGSPHTGNGGHDHPHHHKPQQHPSPSPSPSPSGTCIGPVCIPPITIPL